MNDLDLPDGSLELSLEFYKLRCLHPHLSDAAWYYTAKLLVIAFERDGHKLPDGTAEDFLAHQDMLAKLKTDDVI